MTASEMTASQKKNPMSTSNLETNSSGLSNKSSSLFLKGIEYLSLAIFVCLSILVIWLPENKIFIIPGAISLASFLFLFLFNLQVSQTANSLAYESSIKEKAELYLISNKNCFANNSITPAREKALKYSQEMIDDYKRVRNQARRLYYVLQIATIVLSGVTPILVLVDKLESGQVWLKWLPVICPAIASIVASVVTSFPFQKNAVAANTAVELLEAEQEKFILGITPAYRCYDCSDESEQLQKAKLAIENFIIQVNNIHLNQLQQANDSQPKQENTKSEQPANDK